MKKMIVNFYSLEIASIGFVKISKLKANRQGMVWGKEFKVVLSEKVFVLATLQKIRGVLKCLKIDERLIDEPNSSHQVSIVDPSFSIVHKK